MELIASTMQTIYVNFKSHKFSFMQQRIFSFDLKIIKEIKRLTPIPTEADHRIIESFRPTNYIIELFTCIICINRMIRCKSEIKKTVNKSVIEICPHA